MQRYGCSNSNRSKIKSQIDQKKKTVKNQIFMDAFGCCFVKTVRIRSDFGSLSESRTNPNRIGSTYHSFRVSTTSNNIVVEAWLEVTLNSGLLYIVMLGVAKTKERISHQHSICVFKIEC